MHIKSVQTKARLLIHNTGQGEVGHRAHCLHLAMIQAQVLPPKLHVHDDSWDHGIAYTGTAHQHSTSFDTLLECMQPEYQDFLDFDFYPSAALILKSAA